MVSPFRKIGVFLYICIVLTESNTIKLALYIVGGIFVYSVWKKVYTTYTKENWTKDLQNPVEGIITSKFGNRINPITKVPSFHNGTDIAGKTDTPIYAPLNGVVEKKYFNDAGGNQLIIDSGYPKFGFAHLNKYAEGVNVGTIVKKGQIIGYMGNTGVSTGTHLHFTLRLNDVPSDPQKYFTFS